MLGLQLGNGPIPMLALGRQQGWENIKVVLMLPAHPVPQFPYLENKVAAASVGGVCGSPVLGVAMLHCAQSQVLVPSAHPRSAFFVTKRQSTANSCISRSPGCLQSARHRSALQFTFCSSDESIPAFQSLFGLQVARSPGCLRTAPSLLWFCLSSLTISSGFSW